MQWVFFNKAKLMQNHLLAKYQNFKDKISKLAVNLKPSLSQEKLSYGISLS